MKNLRFFLTTFLTTIATGFSSYSFADATELNSKNKISLAVESPELSIFINYPGRNISNICGVKIASSNPDLNPSLVSKRLIVKLADGTMIAPLDKTLQYVFSEDILKRNQYALGLEIRTKNQKNLSELAILSKSNLNLMSVPCN
jgi:hypothetical protein